MAPRTPKFKDPEPWDPMVLVPLSKLVAFQAAAERCEKLEHDMQRLRHELDGLRGIQADTIDRLGDLYKLI